MFYVYGSFPYFLVFGDAFHSVEERTSGGVGQGGQSGECTGYGETLERMRRNGALSI